MRRELDGFVIDVRGDKMRIIFHGVALVSPFLDQWSSHFRQYHFAGAVVPVRCVNEGEHDAWVGGGIAETGVPEPQIAENDGAAFDGGLDGWRDCAALLQEVIVDAEFEFLGLFGALDWEVFVGGGREVTAAVVGKGSVAVGADPDFRAAICWGDVN